eukprot:CAMPEP_0117671480 /NCGR_PEP_ID=MMETSP0804-20121206/13356_1 /TAXON_ID=1074897 /ORGANISM="Tetraselmis astigmatica, Strain CCMP880" /LENGTH=790 /DNA_ID=CAMNT_0005479943 /DNA_START=52 /DNA_END=2424 /DNA_ORIENTATION=+
MATSFARSAVPLAANARANSAPAKRASAAPALLSAAGRTLPQLGGHSATGHKHAAATAPFGGLRPFHRSTLKPLAAASAEAAETFEYTAEVDRLMDLIVNSLYSNREVFLRELVSNASDALDKARFVGLTKPEILAGKEELEITIVGDPEAKTLTITDSGIGMTKAELMESLGTIARSGTAKFAQAVKESKGDANLIGKFGVGFYSSFLVADKVSVATKSADDNTQWVWESEVGSTKFSVKEDDGEPLVRGTRITLHLKEDCEEMADESKLQALLKTYSEFISFPIKLWKTESIASEVVDEEKTKEAQEAADKEAEEKGEEKKAVDPIMKTDYEDVKKFVVQNDNKPLWVRSPREVTDEEYNEFFRTTFKEFMPPLAKNHFNVEGTIEFSGILFVPGMAPFEQESMTAKSRNMKLYVRRVFISDQFDEDLMPRYLSFMKGIIDSSDLPLNVSREILQENRVVRVIKKQLVKRTLDTLKDLSAREDQTDYNTFFDAFGRNLKLGVIEDQDNKETLAGLLRFYSSKSGDDKISLEKYAEGKKENQKVIYYMAADSKDAAASAPFVEDLVNRGYEVLYLTEPIDEVCVTNLAKFKDMQMVDVSKEDLELEETEEEKAATEAAAKEFEPMLGWMKETLGDKVEKVVISKRLRDSPCILVTSKFGWSANMERIMKTQAMGDNRAMEYMKGRKIMELNPDSPVVKSLKARFEANKDGAVGSDMVKLLYETALITSGFQVESPKTYAERVYEMMANMSADSETVTKSPSADIDEPVPSTETITPEVVDDSSSDPWKK